MVRKLIAFDLDGTLLNSNNEVLASSIQGIETLRAQGHQVVIATGRSYPYVVEIAKELACEDYIMCNGTLGVVGGELVASHPIAPADIKALQQNFQAEGIDATLITADNLYLLSAQNPEVVATAMASFGAVVPELRTLAEIAEPVYQAVVYVDEDQSERLALADLGIKMVRWHPNGIDILPAGVSKATALAEMAAHFQIAQEDIVAFGDGLNDAEMLSYAGIGVAMGNGREEIKAVADYVTASNNEDGIWQALVDLKLV